MRRRTLVFPMMIISKIFQNGSRSVIHFNFHTHWMFYFYSFLIVVTSTQSNLTLHSDSNQKNDYLSTLSNLTQPNETIARNIVKKGKVLIKERLKPKNNQHFCDTKFFEPDVKVEHHVTLANAYDTLTQDDIVRNQYLTLPYPAITPEELKVEKKYYDKKESSVTAYGELRTAPFRVSPGLTLEAINHFLFRGKNNFRSKFRTLIAGGGTDGGTLFMAEQLNHTDSEVLYMDFSTSSMSIAQYKAKMRGWLKIVWVIDWIESIPRLGIGRFDLVASTGVLHHLKNPQKGLSIVSNTQLPHGGAEFMVYGTYGRTPLYWLQTVLRIINEREQNLDEELKNAKHILEILPANHHFHAGDFKDHKTMGNVGIYDLLLHKRDVSYTTTSLYQWLQKSGYNAVDFTSPDITIPISLKATIEEKWLLEKINRLSNSFLYEVGEIVFGHITRQDIYASKIRNSEVNLDSLNDLVIFAYGSPMGVRAVLNIKKNYQKLRNETFIYSKLSRGIFDETSIMASAILRKHSPSFRPLSSKFVWPSTEFNNFILETLTKKPTREISIASLITKFQDKRKSNMTTEEGKSRFIKFYSYIRDSRIFFFKHKSIPRFDLTCCSFNLYSVLNGNA